MPDKDKKFHEFAIKSILFKGRSDWYFCYLKAEKIAHVLLVLKEKVSLKGELTLQNLVHNALSLPQHIAHFAAGEMDLAMVVGDIFGLLSLVRLAGTEGALSHEHSLVIAQEYEQLAERMAAGNHISPFLSGDDFGVPPLPQEEFRLSEQSLSSGVLNAPSPLSIVKDNKGHFKRHIALKGQTGPLGERASLILGVVKKNKGLSIKDISLSVKGVSEKTVQRELSSLISRGLVRKEGDRRWSLYFGV